MDETVKIVYQSEQVTLYCGRAEDVLATLEAGSVDAVITDPPYGIDIMLHPYNLDIHSRACLGREYAPVEGNNNDFDPTPWTGFAYCVLWGANHYAHRLPHNGKWLVWDKRSLITPSRNQADCELAWCNHYGAARICYHVWDGMIKASERGKSRVHPTQKPVAVMEWCMKQADVPHYATVLDPFMGSGTTGVACIQTGRKFIGVEISEEYCEIARKRIMEAEAQPQLSFDTPAAKLQTSDMFASEAAE